MSLILNTLRPRQNGRHFPDDIFKWIFLNENVWISINISLKFVPKSPINNIPALVQIMAWRRSGDKPLSEPMMVCLPTHICVTRPQWVKQHQTHYLNHCWAIINLIPWRTLKSSVKIWFSWLSAEYNCISFLQRFTGTVLTTKASYKESLVINDLM